MDAFLERKIDLNVYLYLKMKDIRLPEDSVVFLREKSTEMKKRREISQEITKDLKKKFDSILHQNDEEISRLHKECLDFEDEIEEYIEKNRIQTVKITELNKDLEFLGNKYTDCLNDIQLLQTNNLELNREIQQSKETCNMLWQEIKDKQIELADREKHIVSLCQEIERLKALKARNIPEVIENNPKLKEEYLQFIRNEWLAAHDEKRDSVRQELAAEITDLEQARSEYAKIANEKTLLEQEIFALLEEKNRHQNQISEFREQFQTKFQGARTEISGFLAEVAVCQGAVGIMESPQTAIYRFTDEISSNSLENIDSINDLIYFLEGNLQKAGVMKKYKGLVASYAAYCWITGRPLLLFGSQARSFANALSTITCGLPADILTLPVAIPNVFNSFSPCG